MTPAGLPSMVVAIPAQDEAQTLPDCLAALAGQTLMGVQPVSVVVLVNNSMDGSAAIARGVGRWLGLDLRVLERTLSPGRAHAGWARRLAMAYAAAVAETDGIIVSTDADAVADPDWLETLADAFDSGVEAVAGRVSGDWEGLKTLPHAALATGELESRWRRAAAELEALLAPQPYDPWPRHRQRSGANLAVRKSVLLEIGGVPPIPCGEDRTLLAAVERAGGRVRHDPRPHVTASARRKGRATGGMADALADRARGVVAIDTEIETLPALVARLRRRAALGRSVAEPEPVPIDSGQLELEVTRLEARVTQARQEINCGP